MAKLIYVTNMSVDGFVEDRHGGFDWGAPDEEYFNVINEVHGSVGTYLYGRRMFETMAYWETSAVADEPPWTVEFTDAWRSAEKVVFSKTLPSVATNRTALEREFDVEAVRRMKADRSRDMTVGGAELAAQAFGADLVDECHLFYWPVVLGGGRQAFSVAAHIGLELLAERRTRSGVAHHHYRVTR